MKLLVNLLILSFIVLLAYQIFSHLFYDNLMEGLENSSLEYKPYPADPMILAQQNAGNIEYLKQQIAGLENMQKEVNDISLNLISVNEQIQGLIQQQQQAATQLVGNTPLTITGTSSA